MIKSSDLNLGQLEVIGNKLGGEMAPVIHEPFLRTRAGLYVDWSFDLLVPEEAGRVRELKPFDLPDSMSDANIEKRLGDGRVWDSGDLRATLEHHIAEQWGGKGGKLVNNGYVNLFYTNSCVVGVREFVDFDEWYVNTWQRGENQWRARYRAFSPAAAA